MVSHIKNAAMTTALVLLTIYVLRQTPAASFVNKALAG